MLKNIKQLTKLYEIKQNVTARSHPPEMSRKIEVINTLRFGYTQ